MTVSKLIMVLFRVHCPLLLSLSASGCCLARINKMQHDISKRFDLANTLAHLLAGERLHGCVCAMCGCVSVSELGAPEGRMGEINCIVFGIGTEPLRFDANSHLRQILQY